MFCKSLFRRVHSVYIRFQPQSLHVLSDTRRLLSSVTVQAHSHLDGAQLREIKELEYLHENEEQSQDFDQNCFVAAVKLDSADSVILKTDDVTDNLKESKIIKTKVKYPLRGMGLAMPVYTDNFENSKNHLHSLNVPTDELQFYPDVQEMSKDDIISCIERLKDSEIHVIFSLFLIQRIFIEITLEKTATKEPSTQLKQWFKLRNGMYKLTSIRYVRLYLELCKLLEDPFLDPHLLLEKLAGVGVYDHLPTIVNKTKKLRSVGAKPKDIMENLELYIGYQVFNSKIKLYQNVIGEICGPFPVKLLLSTTVAEFMEKLCLGNELKEVSKLLNVKESDFLTCWRYKPILTKRLVYKIQMCLQAGIPQADIFNNIGILNRTTVDQCHLVTKSLCKSGQPGSVFVFKQLGTIIQHRAKRARGNTSYESDWTGESGDEGSSDQPLELSGNTVNSTKEKQPAGKNIQSCKRWRKEVFKLVAHLINLDQPSQRAMYKADININLTQLIDVTRNLDYLLSQKFTKESIARCPIVLTHPFECLVRVNRDLGRLMRVYTIVINSPSSSPLPSASIAADTSDRNTHQSKSGGSYDNAVSEDISLHFLSNPVSYLNVLQYFLEKETNFSLNYAQTQSVVEFLN